MPRVYALADAANERYLAIVLLAAFTSLRWDGQVALRRSDVDIPARTVWVARKLHERHGGGFVFSPPKPAAGLNMLAADAGANIREPMDRMGHSTSRAGLVHLHGSNERQQAIAGVLSRQAAVGLGRVTGKPSGTPRPRQRRPVS